MTLSKGVVSRDARKAPPPDRVQDLIRFAVGAAFRKGCGEQFAGDLARILTALKDGLLPAPAGRTPSDARRFYDEFLKGVLPSRGFPNVQYYAELVKLVDDLQRLCVAAMAEHGDAAILDRTATKTAEITAAFREAGQEDPVERIEKWLNEPPPRR